MKHRGEGRGNGLALAGVHLHDVPSVHHEAGQNLLVGNLKNKFSFLVMNPEGLVEAGRQMDLRPVFDLAPLIHIEDRPGQSLLPESQSLADQNRSNGIVEAPPAMAVDGRRIAHSVVIINALGNAESQFVDGLEFLVLDR